KSVFHCKLFSSLPRTLGNLREADSTTPSLVSTIRALHVRENEVPRYADNKNLPRTQDDGIELHFIKTVPAGCGLRNWRTASCKKGRFLELKRPLSHIYESTSPVGPQLKQQ
ncbi:unnamed protein product, partial [Nesidiocoris tenuis]